MKLEQNIRTGEVLLAASMIVACSGFAYSVKLDIADTRTESRVIAKELQMKQDSILNTVSSIEKDISEMGKEIKENEKNDEALKVVVDKHCLLDEQRWTK